MMFFLRKTILALSLAAASFSASAITEDEFKAMPVADGILFAKAFGVPEQLIAERFNSRSGYYSLIAKRVDSNGNEDHRCATLNSYGRGIQGDDEEFSTCKLKDEAEIIKKIADGEEFLIPISFMIRPLFLEVGPSVPYTAFGDQDFFQPDASSNAEGASYDWKILDRYKASETGRHIRGARFDFDINEETTKLFYRATVRDVDLIHYEGSNRKYSYDLDLNLKSIVLELKTESGKLYQEIDINNEIPSPIVYAHPRMRIGDTTPVIEMNGRAWNVANSYKKEFSFPADAEGTYDAKKLSEFVVTKGLYK